MSKCFFNFASSTKSQVILTRSSLPCRLCSDQSNLPKPCSLIISELWWFTLKIKVSSCLKELQLGPLTFLLLRNHLVQSAKTMHSEDQQVKNTWQWENCSGVTNTGKEENGYCSHINSFNIRWGFQTVWKQMAMSECSVRRIYCIAKRSLNFTFKPSW